MHNSSMNLLATRELGNQVYSNIGWNYGHATKPRHLRDIIVTEYGIADLQDKTDSEVIAQLLNITDSRFKNELMAKAKQCGKLPERYEISEMFRNNYPKVLSKKKKSKTLLLQAILKAMLTVNIPENV